MILFRGRGPVWQVKLSWAEGTLFQISNEARLSNKRVGKGLVEGRWGGLDSNQTGFFDRDGGSGQGGRMSECIRRDAQSSWEVQAMMQWVYEGWLHYADGNDERIMRGRVFC